MFPAVLTSEEYFLLEQPKTLSWVFHWVELGHMVTHSCKGGWEARNQRNLSHYLRLDIMIHPLIWDTLPSPNGDSSTREEEMAIGKVVIEVNSKLWDLLQTWRKLQNCFSGYDLKNLPYIATWARRENQLFRMWHWDFTLLKKKKKLKPHVPFFFY